ncbi:MAG: hypothetical protein NTW37_20280 [Proteobacteria bacterium]|nr:hypothetical protein [Pseudomonadota bacterium]
MRVARGGVARRGRFARDRRMCTRLRAGQGARLRCRWGAQGGDRVRQRRIDIEARFVGTGQHPGDPVGTAGQAEALGELAGRVHADGRYMLAVLANRTAALSGHQQLAVLERDPDLLLVGVRCRPVDLGVDGRMAIVALGDLAARDAPGPLVSLAALPVPIAKIRSQQLEHQCHAVDPFVPWSSRYSRPVPARQGRQSGEGLRRRIRCAQFVGAIRRDRRAGFGVPRLWGLTA